MFHGLLYAVHSTVRRANHSLVRMIHVNEEDRTIDFDLLDAPAILVNKTAPQLSSLTAFAKHINADHREEGSIVYAITNRFKKKDCFSGKIGENINELIASCIEMFKDLNIDADQKLESFQNIFEEGAKRMYRSFFLNKASSFLDACDSLPQKYHYPTRQNCIQ